MKITVHYLAQLKQAAGTPSEVIEVTNGCSVRDLIRRLVEHRPGAFRGLVCDSAGLLHPALLVFIGDQQVEHDQSLRDGDGVTVLTPMAGG
ncbi:MAG: MoaD/ThiS family protein [Gemmataceae bacterium]|nr:MoaD/ThiS family protein [Gemmataceae bacterium]MCI0737560.1 MoaD/ThiS family protein [Gemmataceae bacterium]